MDRIDPHSIDHLFNTLDLDKNGELDRKELYNAAIRNSWYWNQAYLYAVLDYLTIRKPLSKKLFIEYLTRIVLDPYGPMGEILQTVRYQNIKPGSDITPAEIDSNVTLENDIISLLENVLDRRSVALFKQFLDDTGGPSSTVEPGKTALLIIDPQRSFTEGVWKDSFGPAADQEVKPLKLAFNNCGQLLKTLRGSVETMFTRCPFPPDSYDWDMQVKEFINPMQPYFIKPGNSVMIPPTNGYREWIEEFLKKGVTTLVMGGCTLNSCVRVSSIDTLKCFSDSGLRVVVDLSICGARRGNYIQSDEYNGRSSVEAAVKEMIEAGVQVVRQVQW